jgi:hypothetical protein
LNKFGISDGSGGDGVSMVYDEMWEVVFTVMLIPNIE